MASKDVNPIPEPTIRRLAHYLHLLSRLKEQGERYVSSTYIADELSLESIKVRKDIQYTGIVGKPKTGFDIEEAIKAITKCLDWDDNNDAFLVGVGSLGTAMLGYDGFRNYGLNFVAAFDSDKSKIGTLVHNIEVLDVERLVVLAKLMKTKIGVLTVPAEVAQKTADMMIEGGIVAIWNFVPYRLKTPSNVIVENAQFSQSLAVLTRKLSIYKKIL